MTTASMLKEDLSPAAIHLINSLGGPPLPITRDTDTLKVSLANRASSHTPVWELRVAEQILRQTVRQTPLPAARKHNPYMHFKA